MENRIAILALLVFSSLLPLSEAHANSADFAYPPVEDTQNFNQPDAEITFPGNFMSGVNKFIVQKESPLYKYCTARSGSQTYYCFARISTTKWLVDPNASVNRRMLAASAPYSAEFWGCRRRSGDYKNPNPRTNSNDDFTRDDSGREGHARDDCNGSFEALKSSTSRLSASGYFCPNGSKFRSVGSIYTDPQQKCGNLSPASRCPAFFQDRKTGAIYREADECASQASDARDCEYRPMGACSSTTVAQYQKEYEECVNPVNAANKANAGMDSDDCFCTHTDSSGVLDYSFSFTNGSWRCMQCAEGMKQSPNGVGCVSRCSEGQGWDPASKSCKGCAEDEESVGGRCRTKCTVGRVRNPDTYECEEVCPNGMVPEISAMVNGRPTYTCSCQDSRFEPGAIRAPAVPSTVAGISVPAWRFQNAVTPNDRGAACVCADGTNTTALFDQAFAVNQPSALLKLPPDGPGLPYGMVPMASMSNPGKLTCGCPNFNERFMLDPVTGHSRCVPQIKGSGVRLEALVDPRDPTVSGVVAAKSDVPTQLTALLRNREELLDTYTRRVWKCRQGYFLDGDTCIAIDESNIGRFACSDDNDQIIPSSPLNPFLRKAMEPGGPLDGTPFSKLTNRRLACCTSVGLDRNGNPKPHCQASTLAGSGKAFDDYYDVAGGTNEYARVSFPNRVYLVDARGNRVTGLYRRNGSRCDLPNAGGPSGEMKVLSEVARRAKTHFGDPLGGPLARAAFAGNPDPQCTTVVRTALEVACKENGTDAFGEPIINQIAIGSDQRCVGLPGSVTVHYDILDGSNPSETHRGIFRNLSSADGGSLATPLDIERFVSGGR